MHTGVTTSLLLGAGLCGVTLAAAQAPAPKPAPKAEAPPASPSALDVYANKLKQSRDNAERETALCEGQANGLRDEVKALKAKLADLEKGTTPAPK
jgi:hypothetical protein